MWLKQETLFLRFLFNKIYLKGKATHGEMEGDEGTWEGGRSSIHWFTAQAVAKAEVGPGWSLELHPCLPHRSQGSKHLGSSSTVLAALAGCWMGSHTARTRIGALVWDATVPARISFYKDTNHLHKAFSQRHCLLTPLHWELDLIIWNLGGGRRDQIQTKALHFGWMGLSKSFFTFMWFRVFTQEWMEIGIPTGRAFP